jgi:hypothetical protein
MNNRGRTILIGVLVGAATGLAAAMMINRRAAQTGESTAITTGEGLKLGVMIVGLLRAIASMGDEDK